MKKLSLETKVGLFFFVVFLLVAWISLKLGNYNWGEARGYTLEAVFPSAAGLDPESRVLMAGIRVGKIEGITLDKGKAKIVMRIRDGVIVPDDSGISIQSKGFLGAKYLEIIPGSSETGYKPETRFQTMKGAGDFNMISGDLQEIADDIKAITGNLREIFGTPEGEQGVVEIFENMQRISTVMGDAMEENQKAFTQLVSNLERFTKNLAYLSDKNREDISNTMSAFPAIAQNLKIISENLAVIMSENNEDIGQTLRALAESTDKLERTMDSVESIARKIDEGEGTVGKLINDDETAENLNEAVEGINDFVGKMRGLQAEIAYRGEYDVLRRDAKSYFNLKLSPAKDRFYMIGVVDDPSGRTTTTDTTTTTTRNVGEANENTSTDEEHKEVNKDELKFTAQLGKRWHDFILRGGLIENSGGIGLEYFVWDDHINFNVEAFDFVSDNYPHLKAGVDINFLKHFSIIGGVDDFMNRYDDPTYFIGGGIRITDDDIGALFSRVPMPDM